MSDISRSAWSSRLKTGFPVRESLKYGVNPHHTGYRLRIDPEKSLYRPIDGDVDGLSATNVMDVDLGARALLTHGSTGVAIVKHVMLTGVSVSNELGDIARCYAAALATDPLATHGTLVIKGLVNIEVAERIVLNRHHVVAATEFTPEALQLLRSESVRKQMRGLRLLLLDLSTAATTEVKLYQLCDGSVLFDEVRTQPRLSLDLPAFADPEVAVWAQNLLGLNRSLCAIVVDGFNTVAVTAGHQNALEALDSCIDRAKNRYLGSCDLSRSTLITDGCFGVLNPIPMLNEHGIRHLMISGGKPNDQDLVAVGAQYGIHVTLTGVRGFRN